MTSVSVIFYSSQVGSYNQENAGRPNDDAFSYAWKERSSGFYFQQRSASQVFYIRHLEIDRP